MPQINRVVVAPYSAADMYALVDDIAAYPQFLPWCGGADVRRDGEQVEATVKIAYRGLRSSFSTRNTHTPPSQIVMRLQSGPLSSLEGEWRFCGIEPNRCRVELDLSYAFGNRVLAAAFSGLFNFVFDRFVDHFIARARAVYPAGGRGKIEVEVALATAAQEPPQRLALAAGATLADALAGAGVGAGATAGVFGRVCPPHTPLANGDRVEVYAPLPQDPRAARRQRLQK